MSQQEFLYDFSSVTIVAVLFFSIILLNEVGYRVGKVIQARTDDELKSLTGAIQASILGLLALLLGFTFSMSMQRYDNRSMALIDETNAIGTAILRVHTLPEGFKYKSNELLKQYVDMRIAIGKVDLTHTEQRAEYNKKINDLQEKLWLLSIDATEADPRSNTTGAFTKALNDLIDKQNKRNALLQMQVPEVVLFLLFIVFVSSGAIIGYSAGLNGKRIFAPIVLLSFLITLIVFIIIDLDRPKRGLIQVDQSIMIDLKKNLESQ